MSDFAISVDGLRVRHRDAERPALVDVSFRVPRGERWAVLGRNGAGKSTLIAVLDAILPSLVQAEVEGEVIVLGRSLAGLRPPDLAAEVGVVFQDFEAQLFSSSAIDEVIFGLEQLGVDPAAMEERAAAALRDVGLTGFESREPTSLSGGEKQRLAIACALARRPQLMLLDEPSTDLDPAGRREVLELMTGPAMAGRSVVVVEHEVEPLVDFDQWLVLEAGEVVWRGRPEALLSDPLRAEALGVRLPDAAAICVGLGLPVWPLGEAEVAARIRESRSPEIPAVPEAASPSRAPADAARLAQVRDLEWTYPGAAAPSLQGVSLELRAGERVSIVGGNGSGKSTLARAIAGLLIPQRGEVVVGGAPVADLGAARRAAAVGYVFQNPEDQLFAETVAEEIAFGPRELGLAPEEVTRRVERCIEMLGLRGLEASDPFLLRKGERQRVAVASILALDPQVLILDEPTTGLDDAEQRRLLADLRALAEEGRAVVTITHVPWFVAELSERVLLLDGGELRFDGSVRELFAREAAGDFEAPSVTRIARRLGRVAVTVDDLLRQLGGGGA